jgi:hypothetical protein
VVFCVELEQLEGGARLEPLHAGRAREGVGALAEFPAGGG